jgi:hypothetical protein
LITDGPASGSPDINDPGHFAGEVDPFLCALYLDDGGNHGIDGSHTGAPSRPGHNVGLYNSFRPSNNGKGCAKNTVGYAPGHNPSPTVSSQSQR